MPRVLLVSGMSIQTPGPCASTLNVAALSMWHCKALNSSWLLTIIVPQTQLKSLRALYRALSYQNLPAYITLMVVVSVERLTDEDGYLKRQRERDCRYADGCFPSETHQSQMEQAQLIWGYLDATRSAL